MEYSKLKKLDEDTLKKMVEGKGPSDECICNILYAPDEKRSFKGSIKKALASLSKVSKVGRKGKEKASGGGMWSPFQFQKETKEKVKLAGSCGKCGCDSQDVVLRHSIANIRIVSPDISSICPCPEDCMPDRDKFKNNIKVTVERAQMHNNQGIQDTAEDRERQEMIRGSPCPDHTLQVSSEPELARKSSSSLDDEVHDDFQYESTRDDSDDEKGGEKPEHLNEESK